MRLVVVQWEIGRTWCPIIHSDGRHHILLLLHAGNTCSSILNCSILTLILLIWLILEAWVDDISERLLVVSNCLVEGGNEILSCVL